MFIPVNYKFHSEAIMTEEWICEKLENLRIKENCLPALAEIQQRLNETPSLENRAIDRLLCSPDIYTCMQGDEGRVADEKIEIVCGILSLCTKKLLFQRKNDMHLLLHRAMVHELKLIRSEVLITILKELYENVAVINREERRDTVMISLKFVHAILLKLEDPETAVSTSAFHILSLQLKHYLDDSTVRDALLEILKKSDVVKCRLYELATAIGNRSAENFEKIEFVLDHALSELDNDDVLLQASILEILVLLVRTDQGLAYLEKRQVFDVLSKRIEDREQNPLDRLLIPGIIKFFSKISADQPEKVINGYPHIIHCVCQCLLTEDDYLLPTAFDAIVNLAYTEQGVYLLEKGYESAISDVFERFNVLLKSLPTTMKVRAMDTLIRTFSFEKEEVLIGTSIILQRWFKHLSDNTNHMEFLLNFCRLPILELKTSTLYLVRSLCHFPWGIQAFKNTAGFLEFLLDRDGCYDESSKYVKFCVISLLANSDAFDIQTRTQLRTYVNEGPFYVRRVAEVEVEGGN